MIQSNVSVVNVVLVLVIIAVNHGGDWYRQGKDNDTCKAEGSDGLCKNAENNKC